MARQEESFRIEALLPNANLAELAAAEAWAAGAEGVEERESSGGATLLLLYAKPDVAASVHAAVEAVRGAVVSQPVVVEDTDWSEAWREGLEAIRVGERLVVRPSWVDPGEPRPEIEVVIDPGQAFGTGAHVSTRLILDWVEAISRESEGLAAGSRVLDVGAGSGVLALAAVALGAGGAVGFDLDPESGRTARHWAEVNDLSDRVAFFVGPIDAVAARNFDWVLANLLKREVLPLTHQIAARTREGGQAILSGLLAGEEDEVVSAFGGAGFARTDARYARDANGDSWVSLRMTRR